MNAAMVILVIGLVSFLVGLFANYFVFKGVPKARRYAVTLINNEGAFIALCTEKHWRRWVFEDVKIQPANPGGPVVAAAPAKLHVPTRNILYYQEIQETANVAQ